MSKSKAHPLKEIFDAHTPENKISIFNQILSTIIRSINDGSFALLDTELVTQQINYFLDLISGIDRTFPEIIESIDNNQERLMLMLNMEESDQQRLYINMALDFLDPPYQEFDDSSTESTAPNISIHEDIGARMRSATFNSNVRFYAENNIMSCSYDSCKYFMGALKRFQGRDDDSTI